MKTIVCQKKKLKTKNYKNNIRPLSHRDYSFADIMRLANNFCNLLNGSSAYPTKLVRAVSLSKYTCETKWSEIQK